MKIVDVAPLLRRMYPKNGGKSELPPMEPWTPGDTLWYDYRDPWAENVPGALERLLSLRIPGGWVAPFNGRQEFIKDGTDRDADACLKQLRECGIAVP